MDIATAQRMIEQAKASARDIDFDMAREAADQLADANDWESTDKIYLVCLAEELEILGLAKR
jgi:hypothetical protein